MRALRSSRPCLAVFAAIAVAASLGGCAYLLGDPYMKDNVIQRATAWIDLDAALNAAGAASLSNRIELFHFDSSVRPAILAMTGADDGSGSFRSYALILDPDSLATVSAIPVPVDPMAACSVDGSGNYRIGNQNLLASDFTPYPANPLVNVPGLDPSAPGFSLSDGTAPSCYILRASDPGILEIHQFGPSFGLAHALFSVPLGFAAPFPNGGWTVLDAQYLAGTAKPLKLLLGNGSAHYCASADGIEQLKALSPIYEATGTDYFSFTADFYGPNSLWLTRDGLIRRGNSNNGVTTYERLDYATGAVLDSLALPDSSFNTSYWFDPSGSFFLFYDGSSGRLYRLRSWWK